MKIIVAVVVFNRFKNIERWVTCWKQSNTKNAELVIIHNYYGDQSELLKYKKYCDDNSILYVPRNGKGFDIGALQDVFKERLLGFPEYDYLLWCCDDTFPMSKDFIAPFIEKLQDKNVGISCMQLSSSIQPHVRTSGFCIRKETASKIKFHVDHITTKQDCYFFEHRGGAKTFTHQVRLMGLSCVQVAPIAVSPLWDSDHPNLSKRLYREEEFKQIWDIKPAKIVFVCPIFDAFPQIISSLICQTHTEWELLLIHDGSNDLQPLVAAHNDKRITYIQRPREANWGHPHRQWALNEIKEERLGIGAEYVVITNADNYYTPNFLKSLLGGFTNGQVAAYCDIVHSYTGWGVMQTRLQLGYLDCGGVVVRKDVATETGWKSLEHSSDWTYFNEIIRKYGAAKWVKVKGVMFVHN